MTEQIVPERLATGARFREGRCELEAGTVTICLPEPMSLDDMDDLRRLMIGMTDGGQADDGTGPLPDVEIHCDPQLDYRHLIDAMTAIKGYIGPDGRVVNMVDSIKLAPGGR